MAEGVPVDDHADLIRGAGVVVRTAAARTDMWADRVRAFLDGSSQAQETGRTMIKDSRNLLQENNSGRNE